MVVLYEVADGDWLEEVARGGWYLVQGYVLAFCAYVFAPAGLYLACAGRINRLFGSQPAAAAQTDFLLLVPAHNEEALLPGLLASFAQLEYPAVRFRVVVVADNCTDGTARLAQQAGVRCLERRTPRPSSKAQALRYAAEVLGLGQPLAARVVVCVLDADCRLDPPFLAELDRQFARPGAAPVAQCNRRVGNAFESDVTLLDAAAEALRQRVGAGTRRLLGLESFIFGLGCCLRAGVFARLVALPSTSLAEDKEWKAQLARQRVRVAYCPAAGLSYQAVASGPAFAKQRRRWLSGHLATVRAHGLAMLAQGLGRARLSQLDFACDLLQPPRSCLLAAALGFGLVGLATGQGGLVGPWVWLGLAGGLLGYGALGLYLVGASGRHFWALLSGARLVAGVAKSAALLLLGFKDKEWRPTR